jgi:hypothetical protein
MHIELKVQQRQTYFDLALIIYGDPHKASELSILYGHSVTDTPTVGTVIKYDVADNNIAFYYHNNEIKPATSNLEASLETQYNPSQYSNQYA